MNLLDYALRFVAPHECLVCYQEGDLLCAGCHEQAVQQLEPRCYRCLEAQPMWRVCAACRPHTAVDVAWIATEHHEAARELVRALKFARAQSGAQVAARLMHQLLPPFPPGAALVPLPTATARVRERGYDQALLITRHLARLRHVPCKPVLRRHGATRQVGASRTQRQQQLQTAFSLARPLPAAHLILVDDVVTTGATIEAAARILKANGAHQVSAALFAQKTKDLPL